jgi:hypothetical protein
MSQGSKDEEFIDTYGIELYLEVQCEIYRQCIRNGKQKHQKLVEKAEKLYGLDTSLDELTDTQYCEVNKRDNRNTRRI